MEFRQAFYQQLHELMATNDKIVVLDADLSKPNGTSPLYKEYPERCFNVGIAEANMVSIAAGLSSYGFIPFIFTFAPFAVQLALSASKNTPMIDILLLTDKKINSQVIIRFTIHSGLAPPCHQLDP